MTKRRLLIIIALLATIDIFLALCYISSLGESGNYGFLDDKPENDSITLADTIPDGPGNIKFVAKELNGYYVSKRPEIANDLQTYYSSIKRYKDKLPTGMGNFDRLYKALAKKAFGSEAIDLDGGARDFVGTPTFNTTVNSHLTLRSAPNIAKHYGNVQGVNIYPVLGSKNFLVMCISVTSYDGDVRSKREDFVAFNLITRNVIYKDNILNHLKEEKTLAAVNKAIEQINSTKGSDLSTTEHLPANIYPSRYGLFFVFPPGTIAKANQGTKKVYVGYAALDECLTKSFADLIATNGSFSDY